MSWDELLHTLSLSYHIILENLLLHDKLRQKGLSLVGSAFVSLGFEGFNIPLKFFKKF
jgi:hypothetical protein